VDNRVAVANAVRMIAVCTVRCVDVCGSTYERDSEEAMKRCRALLADPACDRAVRYGDIYGMMAEHYARRQQWKAVSDLH